MSTIRTWVTLTTIVIFMLLVEVICLWIYATTNVELLAVLPLFISIPIIFGPVCFFIDWLSDTLEEIDENYQYYNKKYIILRWCHYIPEKNKELKYPCNCENWISGYDVKLIFGKKRRRGVPIVEKAIVRCNKCKKTIKINLKGKKVYAYEFL